MGAPDLIEHLKRLGLTLTLDGDELRAGPKTALTDETRDFVREHKAELVAALQLQTTTECRRQRVLSMLEKTPGLRYALVSDAQAEGEDVILTLGIRDLGTCELAVPRAEYGAFEVLRVIEEHSAGEV